MEIFDTPVKFPDVESSCGPEPSLREILAHYYRQTFTADEAAALANKYIDLLGVEAEVARLRAEVEALRSVSNAARQVAAWFTSGNNVPVSGVHQMTVSSNSIMADVHVLNEALAAMGASA